jgi:hypothetical protein
MNQDYATQWLKLAGKCFAWVAGISFVLTLILLAIGVVGSAEHGLILLFIPGFACFYAAIPITIFTSFIITLRAFGRQG